MLDLALAVLFAYWADQPFARSRDRPISRETVLGVLPPLAAVATVTLAFTWGVGWVRWVGLNIFPSASVIAQLKPWLVPYAVLGAAAVALVIFGRRLRPGLGARLIAAFVVVDVVVFTVLCVVEVAPGAFSGGSPGSAASPGPAAAGRTTAAAAAAPLRPVAALGYAGRFAIYDPDQLDPGPLSGLDPPDNNAAGGGAMPSVQGYSSTVDGRYAAVTGSHQATGDGQNTLAPAAVADGTLDQLDTTVLLTLSAYLVIRTDGGGPAGRRIPASAICPRGSGPPGTWAARVRCRGSRCRTRTPGGTRTPGRRSGS